MPVCVGQPSLALSPDGRNLVYVALQGETNRLVRRDMVTGTFHPMPGTEQARSPFFVPRRRVGRLLRGRDPEEGLAGRGRARRNWSASSRSPTEAPGGATTSSTSGRGQTGTLWSVPASGGSPRPIVPRGRWAWPSFVTTQEGPEPLLISLSAGSRRSTIAIGETGDPVSEGQTTAHENLLSPGAFGRYAPTGHLLYVTPGALNAIRFDAGTRRTHGAPSTLIDDLWTDVFWSAQVTISREGTLVYAQGEHIPEGTFVWVDREGNGEAAGLPAGLYGGGFVLSPNGERLAYVVEHVDGTDLWVHEFDRGATTRLTRGDDVRSLAWLPDSESLYYSSTTPEGSRILWRPIEGDPVVVPLPEEVESAGAIGTIAEGNELVLKKDDELLAFSITTGPQEIRSEAMRTVEIPGLAFPSLSPDGRWLAYTIFLTGRYEVVVCSYPDLTQRTQISVSGGEEPRWRGDGKEIAFRWESAWYSVDIATDPELQVGPPRKLFDGPYVNLRGFEWDLSPDGERFLVIENPEQDRPKRELTVITNFFDELGRRLPSED